MNRDHDDRDKILLDFCGHNVNPSDYENHKQISSGNFDEAKKRIPRSDEDGISKACSWKIRRDRSVLIGDDDAEPAKKEQEA